MENIKEKAINGFIWRVVQNSGTQIIGFVISIILARILSPDDYGLIAMITVFTNIAMVFINVGFSSSIIQRKDLTKVDIDTMFYCGIILATVIYLLLFFCAPWISLFYGEPDLTVLLRVESLVVIVGSLYSVQQALLVRELQFKKSCFAGFVGVAVQGLIGICMAYLGFGVWALIAGTLSHSIACAIVMWIIVKWKPSFQFSFESFKSVFGFSSKMLFSELINTIFNNIRSIIIGKQYSSSDLAYYNKGYQFPTLIMTQVDGAMTTVLFSSLASLQEDWKNKGLPALRRAMKLSLYICSPIMLGLFVVAKPLVLLLLTEKWEPSIIFVQLGCIICLFWPLSAQRHALNARGYSGVSLKLNIMGKIITLVLIFATFRYSVELMISSTLVTSAICLCISVFVYRKYLEYPIISQIKDIVPPIMMSVVMACAVWCISLLGLSNIVTLLLQVFAGITIYLILSAIFKIDSYKYLLDLIKSFLKRKEKEPR